ncbi:MAG: hypothetical protein U0169_27245 [Polyangiaceae bacterium]
MRFRPSSAIAAFPVAFAWTTAARADVPGPDVSPIDIHADDVTLDARSKDLDAKGHIRIDQSPFFLTSDALHVHRDPYGVLLEGEGRVGFCPCLGTPLAVRFAKATVAPPSDLLLTSPRIELYGVPVLPLPWFWLRAPSKIGLLPPDLAYRANDGLYLGAGAHLPWKPRSSSSALDLRAGAYVRGGVRVDASAHTETSRTRVAWDHLDGDGFLVDARGADGSADRGTSVAWDVDALRGPRAVRATTELDAAARPYDRVTSEGSLRAGPVTLASGLRAIALRGGGTFEFAGIGPVASARVASALGSFALVDLTADGGVLGGGPGPSLGVARGDGGILVGRHFGPVGATVAIRGAGTVASDGDSRGASGSAGGRLTMSLPFGRLYASKDPRDPWVHRAEPRISGSLLAVNDGIPWFMRAGRGLGSVEGKAALTEFGLASSLGRIGKRIATEWVTAFGWIADDRGVVPATRFRGTTDMGFFGGSAELANVFTGVPGQASGAFVGRGRVGPKDSVHVTMSGAVRRGVDPLRARALLDSATEAPVGFLGSEGWTLGGLASVPIGPYVTVRGGADVDASAVRLLGARGGVEFKDRCGCLVIRTMASHRIGRDGVDVWVAMDIAPRDVRDAL